ncbi:uncharacterized protein LDX57_004716 [Aspergillus melleus]|uniref:uncharacterized protein n=1 Tax=Aspergillus melleus TaxID=138277 RepID=UPI001E8D8D8B|nr:uncharacterized protein LDX57_004716 [Aspergillus melleus]KAH8426995.1 hypothetical protein LDX57_004716 [Aspergillus melleus]
MVSMVDTSHSNQNDMEVVPKPEPPIEGSISSAVSTPEAEGEILTQDVAQTQKRKGGRKPVRKKKKNEAASSPFVKSGAPHFILDCRPFYLLSFIFLYLVCFIALSFYRSFIHLSAALCITARPD